MKKFSLILVVMGLCLPSLSFAKNYPCSKKKGGVAYCSGSKFVCNDGSVSKSKQICSGYDKPVKTKKPKAKSKKS